MSPSRRGGLRTSCQFKMARKILVKFSYVEKFSYENCFFISSEGSRHHC